MKRSQEGAKVNSMEEQQSSRQSRIDCSKPPVASLLYFGGTQAVLAIVKLPRNLLTLSRPSSSKLLHTGSKEKEREATFACELGEAPPSPWSVAYSQVRRRTEGQGQRLNSPQQETDRHHSFIKDYRQKAQ